MLWFKFFLGLNFLKPVEIFQTGLNSSGQKNARTGVNEGVVKSLEQGSWEAAVTV